MAERATGEWLGQGGMALTAPAEAFAITWAKAGGGRDDLIASGTADTFEAAKAAALFEARAQSPE